MFSATGVILNSTRQPGPKASGCSSLGVSFDIETVDPPADSRADLVCAWRLELNNIAVSTVIVQSDSISMFVRIAFSQTGCDDLHIKVNFILLFYLPDN
jgi:hypothetical protein